MKTGGWNSPWVTLEPKPLKVTNHYDFWGSLPTELSPRCMYWLRQIDRGWRPNRYVRRMGYDESAEWYGVYIAEYNHLIVPRLAGAWASRSPFPNPSP